MDRDGPSIAGDVVAASLRVGAPGWERARVGLLGLLVEVEHNLLLLGSLPEGEEEEAVEARARLVGGLAVAVHEAALLGAVALPEVTGSPTLAFGSAEAYAGAFGADAERAPATPHRALLYVVSRVRAARSLLAARVGPAALGAVDWGARLRRLAVEEQLLRDAVSDTCAGLFVSAR